MVSAFYDYLAQKTLRSSSLRSLRYGVVLLSLSALTATQVQAQSRLDQISDADKYSAKKLVEAGDAKFRAGDYVGALNDYRGADTIMGVPTTTIEVARTLEVLGRLLEARDTYRRIVARQPATNNEPSAFAAARERARQRLPALMARIPKLIIDVTPASADVVITVDGKTVDTSAPIEVDPGEHRIAATHPTMTAETQTVDVVEGTEQNVRFQLIANQPPAPVNVTDSASTPPSPSRQADNADSTTWPIVMWTGFGVAVAGTALGAMTGALSLSKASEFEEQRLDNGKYPSSAESLQDESISLAHVSTIGFVVAGLGAAAGVVGLTMSLQDDHEDSIARMNLVVSPTRVSLTGSF